MKALLLKDCYLVIKQLKVFIIFIVLFSIMPGMSVNLFAVVYASMLPYTCMAYDERSHWDQLAAMLPYSVRELVLSKYVLGWICIVLSALLSVISQMIASPFIHNTQPLYLQTLLGCCTGAIVLALTLPMMFRFGVERGRMAVILGIAIGVAFAGGVIAIIDITVIGNVFNGLWLLLLVLAMIILTIISISLSFKFYQVR